MRPVRRGSRPASAGYESYQDAKHDLASRLGEYCSYCERKIPASLAVEHILHKDDYPDLATEWSNLLLACVHCNSTKGTKDVSKIRCLLPDRDNTFAAFDYDPDGTNPSRSPKQRERAKRTLKLVGLDQSMDSQELVAGDRWQQRIEVWMKAVGAKEDLDSQPRNRALRKMIVSLAIATGHFSIWMTVFEGDIELRQRLIDAFPGTRESECFDPRTTEPITPGPNLDRLERGGAA